MLSSVVHRTIANLQSDCQARITSVLCVLSCACAPLCLRGPRRHAGAQPPGHGRCAVRASAYPCRAEHDHIDGDECHRRVTGQTAQHAKHLMKQTARAKQATSASNTTCIRRLRVPCCGHTCVCPGGRLLMLLQAEGMWRASQQHARRTRPCTAASRYVLGQLSCDQRKAGLYLMRRQQCNRVSIPPGGLLPRAGTLPQQAHHQTQPRYGRVAIGAVCHARPELVTVASTVRGFCCRGHDSNNSMRKQGKGTHPARVRRHKRCHQK